MHAEVNQVIVRTVDSGDWAETDLPSSDGESDQQELAVLVEAEVQRDHHLLAISAHYMESVALSTGSKISASLGSQGDQVRGHHAVVGLKVPHSQLVILAHGNSNQPTEGGDGTGQGLVLPLLGGQ